MSNEFWHPEMEPIEPGKKMEQLETNKDHDDACSDRNDAGDSW